MFILSGIISCSVSQKKTEVSQESLHRTKVWLLERYPLIEHPLITELFTRSVNRIEAGIQSISPSKDAPNESQIATPRFYLISSPEISAFSLCDGSIFMTSTMLQKIQNVEVFMAVLAHEISHIIMEDACLISLDKKEELKKEIHADANAARILYVSFINPNSTLDALSIYYRSFINDDAKNAHKSLDERKKSLILELQQYPPIQTRVPEERVFRKVKHLIYSGR